MIVLLRQVILSVTAASLFGAVALALVPDGALKEAIRLGVGIVLILSLVIPLRGALPSGLSDLLPKAAEVQQDEAGDVYRAAIQEQVEAQTAEYVVIGERAWYLLPQAVSSRDLRPAARLVRAEGGLPEAEEALKFLQAHAPELTLGEAYAALLRGEPVLAQTLRQTEGRLLLAG